MPMVKITHANNPPDKGLTGVAYVKAKLPEESHESSRELANL